MRHRTTVLPIRQRRIRALVLLLMFASFVKGTNGQQQSTSPATAEGLKAEVGPTPASQVDDDVYRIGPGDLLEIRVIGYPQLSRDSVRVNGRGMIRMPLIDGEIRASCKTEGELEKEVASRYLKYLLKPQITIFVKDYQSQSVAVIGAVKSPTRFLMQRRVRLLELLSFVGGPTDQAGRSIQVVHSPDAPMCDSQLQGSAQEGLGLVSYRLDETLEGLQAANPFVQPGDIVSLPQAEQILIVGNVLKPTAIALKEPLTVSRAIAFAGGILPDTKTDRVRIIRQIAAGQKTSDVFVDLKAIDSRKAEDILLQPNDILDVPKTKPSGSAKIMKQIVGTLVPTIGTLPVRVIP